MAEQKPQQDRTEQPTQKRRQDARKKGDVPRSRELTMTGVILSGATSLLFMAAPMADNVGHVFAQSFSFERSRLFDTGHLTEALGQAISGAVLQFLPFAAVLMIAVFASAALIGGWSFSMKAANFKGSRISPLKGIKRIFSANSIMELLKALSKFAIVISIAIAWLWWSKDDLLLLGQQPIGPAIQSALELCGISLLVVGSGLILIALVDVPFQLWNYQKKLRMTRTEVRDEFKETEGRPEVKAKIRALQQQVATRRMMDEVPSADVVVTNPTRFAIALRYDDGCMGAPRVVAKGKNLIAARIRAIAEENNVPLFSAPTLARALFRSTELGHEIPAGLYTAVAQVLAYVFHLADAKRSGEVYPDRPDPVVDESIY